MPPEKWSPGPTGDRVADNVRELRGQVSLEELAERLNRLGRRIAPDSIRNVEQVGAPRRRRVDVDDLVALSIALGTNPNRLLLPSVSSIGVHVPLTATVKVPANLAWGWARGDAPIEPWAPGSVPEGASPQPSLDEFRRLSRPAPLDTADQGKSRMARGLRAAAEVTRVLAEQAEFIDMEPEELLDLVDSIVRHPASRDRVGQAAKLDPGGGADDDG